MGNLNRSKGTNGTPSWAYTNSVPDQHSIYSAGPHTLAFYAKCLRQVHSLEHGQVLQMHSIKRKEDVCLTRATPNRRFTIMRT